MDTVARLLSVLMCSAATNVRACLGSPEMDLVAQVRHNYNYNYNYNINLYSAALQCCPGALNNVTYSKT